MRSALLLTLGACAVISVLRVLLSAAKLPYGLAWLMESAVTLLAFGGGAYLGLFVLDGDHGNIVPVRTLSRAQLLWFSLLGILAVCPALLVQQLLGALAATAAVHSDAQTMESVRLTAMIAKSVLLVPVCEEVFFRGYLLHALERCGRMRASVIVSLCFALVHTLVPAQMVVYVLLSLLLCWMTMHTQSILSAVIVHAAYNLALVVLGSMGLAGLFTGWSMVSCVVRLAGCVLFAAVLKRAYTARRERSAFVLWEGGKLSRREMTLLCAAALLLLATLVTGG